MKVAELLAWQQEQKYVLRTGRRAYTGPAYRDDGVVRTTTNRRAHLIAGRPVVSLSLDGMRFGEGRSMGLANGGGRHTVAQECVDAAVEDGLFYLEEQRQFAARRRRLEQIIDGLEEADRIEEERALNRVRQAREELREADEELVRIQEINAQKVEVRGELRVLDQQEEQSALEGKSRIALDGHKAGFAYVRKELLEPGALKKLVKDRKVRVGLSPAEAEAI